MSMLCYNMPMKPGYALLCAFLAIPAAVRVEAANTLRDVEVYANGVRLSLDRAPRYTAFLLKEPDRLVLDFHDTLHAVPSRELEGEGLVLERVRSSQMEPYPEPATRVVLDLSGPVRYWAAWDGTRMSVRLEAAGLRDAAGPLHHPAALGAMSAGLKTPLPAAGAFPKRITPASRQFKGRLTDSSGSPLNGTFLLRFFCLDGSGRSTWEESLYVKVRKGLFRAALGRLSPLPAGDLGISASPPPGTGWRVLSLD